MTEQEQNEAIAEALGVPFDICQCGDSAISHRIGGNEHSFSPMADVPDYLHDLNAMHEAEKTLSEKQQVWYLQKLTQVRYKQGVGGMIACMIDKTTFATASQRAEAFLRTIGKWRDEGGVS